MCGIVGLFGKIDANKLDVFEEMFKIDVMRGDDSCGIAVIDSSNHTTIVKDVIWPDDLIEEDAYLAATWKQQSLDSIIGLIGHNRSSTRGKVSQQNAHPFRKGGTTLVHNGTVWDYKFTSPNKETDSETIACEIDAYGIDSAWKKMDGAAALVYWDEDTSKLYMISNGKRPLWFMSYGNNWESMFFASEPWMILTACARIGIPYREFIKNIWHVKEHVLYEFEFDGTRINYTSRTLEEYKEPPRQSWYNGRGDMGYSGYGDFGDWDGCDIDPNEDRPHAKDCNCSECCAGRVKAWEEKSKQEGGESVDRSRSFPGEDPFDQGASLSIKSARRVAALRVRLTDKKMDEQVFERHYPDCSCCGKPLKGQYKVAVIINSFHYDALCGNCAAIGEFAPQPGVNINNIYVPDSVEMN